MVYIIQVFWQLASRIRTEYPSLSCPKHVEFYSKNKFEKLVHLVCFYYKNLSRCTVAWTSNSFAESMEFMLREIVSDRSVGSSVRGLFILNWFTSGNYYANTLTHKLSEYSSIMLSRFIAYENPKMCRNVFGYERDLRMVMWRSVVARLTVAFVDKLFVCRRKIEQNHDIEGQHHFCQQTFRLILKRERERAETNFLLCSCGIWRWIFG